MAKLESLQMQMAEEERSTAAQVQALEQERERLRSENQELFNDNELLLKETESLVQQVTQSVDWLGCIRWFSENDYDAYTEFGPGRVLSGLIRRIHRGAAIQNVQDIETAKSVAESLGN